MKMPLGSKADLPLQQLAEGLKGHRFLVEMPGDKPGEYYRQLVEVTGEYDWINRPDRIEVKAVNPDAQTPR